MKDQKALKNLVDGFSSVNKAFDAIKRDAGGKFSSSGSGSSSQKRAPLNSTAKTINKLASNAASNANRTQVVSSAPSKKSEPQKPSAPAKKAEPQKSETKKSGSTKPDWKIAQEKRMAARAANK